MPEEHPETPAPNPITELAGNLLGAILVGTIEDQIQK